ncbi:MAG: NAD-dependent epimerase/dehydratase family protein [Planctomycetota bacterium]|nr:MAG: NAD-dependent epimerase/dehydratase family protein [Planctomycetota bacterium]
MKVVVTGSSGLMGSEALTAWHEAGSEVVGLDNNMRRDFFGAEGDTSANRDRLRAACPRFRHLSVDIRDRAAVSEVFARERLMRERLRT